MVAPVMRIGLAGATGRMGRAVAELAAASSTLVLAAQWGRPQAGASPSEAGGAIEACEVVIDFSPPEACARRAGDAAARGGPALVIGSTGFSADQEAAVAQAARRVAIVKSGNFSIGLNVLAGLVEQAARRLGAEEWDIEIIEAHHRRKLDAPSGTAMMLGEAAARGRGVRLEDVRAAPREGITPPRVPGTVGISVVRAGGLVGEHAVVFAAEEEVLTLGHSARDRRLFARGALAAAAWVRARPPGLYDMIDVLGLRD